GTSIAATNDPRYVFTINYAGGDGNDITATLQSVVTTNLVQVDGDGLVTFASGDNLDNHETVSNAGGNYSITDTAQSISLTQGAINAGWTGDGTNTVTGPVAGATGLALTLNSGSDSIAGIDAGSVPVSIAGTGTLSIDGPISTTSNVTISGVTNITGTGAIQ